MAGEETVAKKGRDEQSSGLTSSQIKDRLLHNPSFLPTRSQIQATFPLDRVKIIRDGTRRIEKPYASSEWNPFMQDHNIFEVLT